MTPCFISKGAPVFPSMFDCRTITVTTAQKNPTAPCLLANIRGGVSHFDSGDHRLTEPVDEADVILSD